MADSPGAIAIFYLFAAITVAGAGVVAFSKKIVYSAFALLATFFGVAGLYAFLAADLLAVVQLLVYVGGILVLILFAVMLTSRIGSIQISNPSIRVMPALALCAVMIAILVFVAVQVFGDEQAGPVKDTAADLGDALLGAYVLPFEAISILLLAVLLGAVTLARGHHPEDD